MAFSLALKWKRKVVFLRNKLLGVTKAKFPASVQLQGKPAYRAVASVAVHVEGAFESIQSG